MSVNYARFSYYLYDETVGKCVPREFYVPLPKASEQNFGPVPEHEAGMPWKMKVAPDGARYCEELDAYVPAHLTYTIRGIKQTKAPLKDRMRSRRFWRVDGKDAEVDRTVCAIGLTHGKMTLVSLKDAQSDEAIRQAGAAPFASSGKSGWGADDAGCW
ncbi:hypothetical protein POSPLADRAFT_1033030 [Postia placenta MAD-698-R-SB12]|uniref:Uncharacterized protein n=1 Tax=Postia placenta MAD-698-R-SB12 TaxID=670580 RepID=A0A1X6N4H1_9APHY|nr:hypothetical protein POSPLADRAFT_1033030 [Postia placenta MAD-698-R-SB12]OSX63376.1 hypothetical protein POSPLADRAFT_1033030 [Postia placenta MAD-698-R-SB12]